MEKNLQYFKEEVAEKYDRFCKTEYEILYEASELYADYLAKEAINDLCFSIKTITESMNEVKRQTWNDALRWAVENVEVACFKITCFGGIYKQSILKGLK